MTASKRRRPVHKAIWFSEDEWSQVEDSMLSVRQMNFSSFARQMILSGQVLVNSRPMDAMKVRAMLAPIGRNIAQIARQVNIDQVLYLEDLAEVRALMEKAVQILEQYATTEHIQVEQTAQGQHLVPPRLPRIPADR